MWGRAEFCWVYRMQAGDLPLFKIGRAVNPWGRLYSLQTGCPYELKMNEALKYRWPTAFEVERTVHEEMASLRLRGEWFEIPDERDTRCIFTDHLDNCLSYLDRNMDGSMIEILRNMRTAA